MQFGQLRAMGRAAHRPAGLAYGPDRGLGRVKRQARAPTRNSADKSAGKSAGPITGPCPQPDRRLEPMKRTLLALAGLMLAAGLATPTPAAWAGAKPHPNKAVQAHRPSLRNLMLAPRTTLELCSSNGAGYCMNDWNGSHIQGAAIKMYYGHSSNEQFEVQGLNLCNSDPLDQVTRTCPFVVGSGLNARYEGATIFQLYYPDANKCIGTVTGSGSNAGNAILTGCNNSAGSGGGDGTILINPGTDNSIIDRYWTDQSPSTVVAYLCGTGFENPLTTSSSSLTSACQWQAPPGS